MMVLGEMSGILINALHTPVMLPFYALSALDAMQGSARLHLCASMYQE